MEGTVFLNQGFIKADKAKVSLFEPLFLYGWGIFETMRSYNNRIVYLDEHIRRIKSSSKLIDLEDTFPLSRLKKIIRQTVKINGFFDACVRLTLWKSRENTGILVAAKKYQSYSFKKYKTGFCAVISSLRQNEDSYLARIKTTNRIFYELSLRQAKAKGADEAIILNNRGFIAECSRSNIFLAKDNELFTPALECGCLDGITRKVVFDLAKKYNVKIFEGRLTVKDLSEASEAFLTNSLMGVMPLVSVEKQKIGKGKPGRITGFFLKKYNSLVKNGT